MSFKERMQELSSTEELHELMQELLVFGSPGWTYNSAALHVPAHLWSDLAFYFDATGNLRYPDPKEVKGEQFNVVELLNKPQAVTVPTAGSLSEVIAKFHTRLEAVRVEASSTHERVDRDRQKSVGKSAGGAVEIEGADTQSVEEAARGDLPPAPAEPAVVPSSECPICLNSYDEPLGTYRGKQVCRDCIGILPR